MNVAIIGVGYVGLVSGVCLATKGHNVTCYDKNNLIINKLNSGTPTIYEKGLSKLLKDVIKKGKFSATNNFIKAISDASIILIAVGTPPKKMDQLTLITLLKSQRK